MFHWGMTKIEVLWIDHESRENSNWRFGAKCFGDSVVVFQKEHITVNFAINIWEFLTYRK